MITEPIKPMTHVIVMKKGEASGSTLGYHGTVIRHVDRSVLANADRPSEWTYRIYIPVLDAQFEIAAARIIATDRLDSLDSIQNVCSEIQFDTYADDDTNSSQLISGAIRLNECDWLHFHFRKNEGCSDRYHVSMPTNTLIPIFKRLNYFVARDARLDRDFVRKTLRTMFGQTSIAR